MRFHYFIPITLFTLASCSSKPVDCYKVAPSDCERYSQCRTIAAGRVDTQCAVLSDPVACWPNDVPGCQLEFYLRDPAGQCWGMGECFVPQGWNHDDGSCYRTLVTISHACFPQDAGSVFDSGTASGADTGED